MLRSAVSLLALSIAAPALADDAGADATGHPATMAALAAAASAPGEDTSYAPGEIVITGTLSGYATDDGSISTKTPTPLIDTPQAITVLTRDQLDDQNVRQLNEALRYVAGISMETGEGHRDEIFIRGQETTADFFLNGLRDDAQYYRSLYNVERVEILKGANALIFGRGGGGGIVNRVSKVADPMDSFIGASGSINTFGAFALGADANQPLGDLAAIRLNGTYEEFDTHRDVFEGRFVGINPTVTLDAGSGTRIVASYSYEDDERVVDRGVPSLNGAPLTGFDEAFFGDPDLNRFSSDVQIARARVDHELAPGLSLNVSGQYASYDKSYANVVPASTDGTTIDLTGYRDVTDRENVIGQANLIWTGDFGEARNTFLTGVEYIRQDTRNGRQLVEFATPTGPATRITVSLQQDIDLPALSLTPFVRDRDSDLSVFSAYIQNQLEFGIVEIVGGLRYEIFDLDTRELVGGVDADRRDEKWSPRVGLILKPQENLSLYASYTESFLPQSGDQFLVLTPTTADLEPERFENVEAGVKWAPREDILVSAAIFDLERSNSRTSDPADPTLTVLTGRSRTRGFELQVAGNITPDWHANIGYTYLDGEIRSPVGSSPAGTTLQQVPDHHFAAWTRYDLSDRFAVAGGIIHQSDQFASLSNAVVLPAYTRVDLAAYFDATENVSVQVNIENLFDEDHYPSAHGDNNIQPAKPLNASISARVHF